MSTEGRTSHFGVGFSKQVDSILAASQLGHLYPDEVRENLRLAGMVLYREAQMPEFDYQQYVPAEEDGEEPMIDQGDDDEQ